MADRNEVFRAFERHPDIAHRPNQQGQAKAWCPWHEDRAGGNPSLGINFKRFLVKCFTCGKGGWLELAKAWEIPLDDDRAGPVRELEATYDYLDKDGNLQFQVVRYKTPTGKTFLQRRPHPTKPDEWVWNLQGIRNPVLYHLPELRAADPDEWVWVVEGEKDVDRLRSSGLIATTSAAGAGKWRAHHTSELAGRKVAIIPDEDDAGLAHAERIATVAWDVANDVRVVRLPDVGEKGDVSDYLDAGNAIDDLLALLERAPSYEPSQPDQADIEAEPDDGGDDSAWRGSNFLQPAVRITELMQGHGHFVNGAENAYFFDQHTKRLMNLDRDDRALRILLNGRYKVNRQEALFGYLLEHLLIQAHRYGHHSLVRKFSYYDPDRNIVYLDMGEGRVLRVTAQTIDVRDNGEDGVLFLPMPDHQPWEYNPNHQERLLYESMVAPVNFTDEGGTLSVSDQRALFLLWMVSTAFESMMPTKVLAMAIGPGESGKSSLFRYCGRVLIGPGIEVDGISQQDKAEDDFWVNLSHSFFVTYDNVDQYVKWLPDALAQVATGIRRSKRVLHTTNEMQRFKINCMVTATARTPSGSLRREDVAGRSLVFNLSRLESKRAEFEMDAEVARLRDDLLSDYAGIVQKTLRVRMADVEVADPGMRMADFARVATRIGMGLGPAMAQKTHDAMTAIRSAQNQFATEEDEITSVLRIWVGRTKPRVDGEMDVGETPNGGRQVSAQELMQELNTIARELDMKLYVKSPTSLGRHLKNMEQALSDVFLIDRGRTKSGNTWCFESRDRDTEI